MEQVSLQKTETKKLTEGSPWRLLLLFSLPLMAGNVFQQLYTVVDTAVVGQVLGVEALAALGAVEWLNWLMLGAIQGFSQGFAILMAQKFGASDQKRLRQVVANAIVLSLICAAVLTAAGQIWAGDVLTLLHTPQEIRGISMAYLRILFGGLPVVMAYNLAASILRSVGNSRTPLIAMVLAACTNIGLDLLFVMKFGWGVEGAAIATVIAQLLSAVYCFVRIVKIPSLHLRREDFRIEGALCKHLMTLGAPMAFQNGIISVGGMIVQTMVNGFGVAFIAGFTATNKLYGVLEVAAISYGYAMTTYAGQNLGAGKLGRISRGVRAGLVIAMVTSCVITACMLLFGKGILSFFIAANAKLSGQALEVAFHYLAVMAVFLPILYVLHITRSCIQGLGNTMLPMASGIAEFFMRTGAALLLPAMFGAEGIMFAEPLAWAGADLILIPSYFFVMKKINNQTENGKV